MIVATAAFYLMAIHASYYHTSGHTYIASTRGKQALLRDGLFRQAFSPAYELYQGSPFHPWYVLDDFSYFVIVTVFSIANMHINKHVKTLADRRIKDIRIEGLY